MFMIHYLLKEGLNVPLSSNQNCIIVENCLSLLMMTIKILTKSVDLTESRDWMLTEGTSSNILTQYSMDSSELSFIDFILFFLCQTFIITFTLKKPPG